MRIRAILRFRNEDLTRKRLIAGFKTQQELADYLEINVNNICSWETLKTYPKEANLILQLESALNCKVDEIFPSETIEAINNKIGIPIEKVADMKQLPSFAKGEYLLESPEEIYNRKELEKNVENLMESISERERKVLEMRFGIKSDKVAGEHTIGEIASIMNISRARVYQIEAKAIRKLRHPSRSRKIINQQGLI